MDWNSNSFKMFPIIFAIAFMAFQVTADEIPSYIHVCGRKNANYDQCISDSIMNFKEVCRIGMPELKLPSYQPLYLDRMTFFNLTNMKIFLKNTYINGMCDYKMSSFHMDLEKNHFDIDLIFDRLEINGTYDFNVRILVPIVATGIMFITTDNVSAKVGMDLKTVEKNHKTHIYVSAMQLKLHIKGYDITYGAVESDTSASQLREIFHSFVGNNKEEILRTITPFLEQAVSKVIFNYANDIVTLYTYDQLMPDRE